MSSALKGHGDKAWRLQPQEMNSPNTPNTLDLKNFPTDGKDHGCFSFLFSVVFSIRGGHSSQLNSTVSVSFPLAD